MLKRKIFFIGIFFLLTAAAIYAQENSLLKKFDNSSNNRTAAVQLIFTDMEKALSSGNFSSLSTFFCSQTYLSLSNGVSGYYSSNQAYYILEDFFKIYNVTSFRFKNIHAAGSTPYATGIYSFEFKGKKDNAQVYISLKQFGSGWKITQITIN